MEDILHEFYYKLVDFQKNHVWAILFLSFIVTGAMLFYALRVEVDSTLDQQLKPEDDYLTIRDVMSREFGQTDSLFVVIKSDEGSDDSEIIRDMRHPRVIESIAELEETLSRESGVNATSSIAGVFDASVGSLPGTLDESKEMIRAIGPQAEGFFTDDKSATIIILGVDTPKDTLAREDFENRIRRRISEASFPKGVSATMTGFPVILSQIITLMITDSLTTLLVAFVFVFIVLFYLFRKLSLTLITVVPVAFSIIWLGGAMTLLGIKLSVANATVAAMVIGIGVDYAIHMVHTFDTRIRQHESKPITKTTKLVGTALFLSFITTFIGFAINLLGPTEAVRVQGLTLALGVTFSYIATMALTPVLLKLKLDVLRTEFGESKWK